MNHHAAWRVIRKTISVKPAKAARRRRVTQKMGGTVEVESEEGKGVDFSIGIPIS